VKAHSNLPICKQSIPTEHGGTPKIEKQNRHGRDQPETVGLVWQQINNWVWASECGRYKIERFIPGDHELLGLPWPERFRVLKRTPEWYGDLGSEPSLADAQRVCEGLT
jgi:hypothetical protein